MGLLIPCYVPREAFVHNDCPAGRAFVPFKSCPGGLSREGGGWFWMKLIPAGKAGLTGQPGLKFPRHNVITSQQVVHKPTNNNLQVREKEIYIRGTRWIRAVGVGLCQRKCLVFW